MIQKAEYGPLKMSMSSSLEPMDILGKGKLRLQMKLRLLIS